jgi:hypothetical protein
MMLTKKSKQLILFFKNNGHINYTKQTAKTKNILFSIYEDILESYNYLLNLKKSKNKYFNVTIKKIHNKTHIIQPQNFHSKSFPDIIRTHINDTAKYELTYTFSLYERNIKVYFIVEEDIMTDVKLETFNRYIDNIIMWLYILNKYASNNCVNTLAVYIYFTSLEKQLPETNVTILDEIQINTAFTTSCPKNSEIVVYRREEWFKVFIHESFHNFGLDFSDMDIKDSTRCILNIFKVNSEVNLYESYAEFWAEIMNALFCAFFKLKNKNNIVEFLSNAEIFINFERTYSFFQLIKTLHFMGLTYRNLYLNDESSRTLREKLYKEKTNVLSYYIIKTVLINNYQGLLSWCKTNNYSLLQFKKTISNQMNYCKFIEKNYKTTSMLESIVYAEKFYNKVASKNKKNFLLSNLRMSICELG